MKILVTGSQGMIGKSLVANLKNLKENKNKTRPNIKISEIFEFTKESKYEELEEYCKKSDFIFNLVGVNRTENKEEFIKGNYDFTLQLIELLKKYNNKAVIMQSSSIQASLEGRFYNSEYGISKRAGENLLFDYSQREGVKVAIYRFPNLMGHSKPNYNSAVSTFCWAIANDKPFEVSDYNMELELLYIDDLIEGMFDLLEGKEERCDFNGIEVIPNSNGKYCYISNTHKASLGEIINLLYQFKSQSKTLMIPDMPENSFAKKLYSLYLTYLPKEKFKYELKMNRDERGSFTELIHTLNCGQVSVNVSKPGITKGQHWHNSKWEIFMVVSGCALIRERNIYTGETIEFEVSGEKLEAVYMIPGWTHSITNLSNTENLVTVMTCNEIFNPEKPDTFFELV